MDKKPIMDIKIEANGEAVHLKGENGEVLMVPFKGSVDCELFHGIVEPCGVDTQVVNAAHVRHMSARYMLTGKDNAGQDARIYVENNGWFDDLTKTMPFHNVAQIGLLHGVVADIRLDGIAAFAVRQEGRVNRRRFSVLGQQAVEEEGGGVVGGVVFKLVPIALEPRLCVDRHALCRDLLSGIADEITDFQVRLIGISSKVFRLMTPTLFCP